MRRTTHFLAELAIAAVFALATWAPHVAAADLVPEYARTVLPNGLVVLLLEHHEVPVVDFNVMLRTGSINDPAGKEGLADVTVSMLRKGTQKLSSEQLAEELDYLGAELDMSTGFERCAVSASFLAKDATRGLDLLADILTHPKLDAAEVRKLVDLNVDGLKDLKDTPRQAIGPYYDGFLFAGHPFGRPVGGTEASLAAITAADVSSFYSKNVRPNGAVLAVAGDFDTATMRAAVEKAFGGWEKGDFTPAKTPAPKPFKGRKVLLVDKPDATQTYFRFGNLGIAEGDPQAPAIEVTNTVFGGRFTSWLMTELRTKSGLSYNAHAAFVRRKVPGAFYVSSFTRADDTGKAMDLALELLDRLHKKGFDAEELQSAKNYIRGQYPPGYETPGQLASAMNYLEFFGLERSYINERTQRSDNVQLGDTKKAISAHYPSKDMAIVMVGPASKIRKTAAKYGSVTEKSITAPGF